MARYVIVEGNSNDKYNVRVIMVKGEQGYSAYDLYVQHGGTLTEEQWLNQFINADNYYNKSEINTLGTIEKNARETADTTLQNNINAEITNRTNADTTLQNQISSLASGSPLVASSTSEMTDTSRVYVNTSDGYWYYYDGDSWEQGGIYQASELSQHSIKSQNLTETILEKIGLEKLNWISGSFSSANYDGVNYSSGLVANANRCTLNNMLNIPAGSIIKFKPSKTIHIIWFRENLVSNAEWLNVNTTTVNEIYCPVNTKCTFIVLNTAIADLDLDFVSVSKINDVEKINGFNCSFTSPKLALYDGNVNNYSEATNYNFIKIDTNCIKFHHHNDGSSSNRTSKILIGEDTNYYYYFTVGYNTTTNNNPIMKILKNGDTSSISATSVQALNSAFNTDTDIGFILDKVNQRLLFCVYNNGAISNNSVYSYDLSSLNITLELGLVIFNDYPYTDVSFIPNEIVEKDEKNINLFMFMGQSNMAGRGATNSTYSETAPSPNYNIGFEYRAVSSPNKLFAIYEPFGKNENNANLDDTGLKSGSMVTSFANNFYNITKRQIVGVSSSKGGTNIDQWLPNSNLLNESISRLNATVTYLNSIGYNIVHKYMLWCQGESDGDRNLSKSDYKTKFLSMFDEMKANGIEKCFLVRIGEFNGTGSTDYSTIIEAETEICKENKDVIMASTEFAGLKDMMKDLYHYYQKAYNIVGNYSGINVGNYEINQKEPTMYDPKYNNLYYSQIN